MDNVLPNSTEPGSEWEAIDRWWLDELRSDPAYHDEVEPLLLELANPSGRVLDVGCGEGHIMAGLSALGAMPFGIDVSAGLLAHAVRHGPVIRYRLPRLDPFRDDAFDGAVICLVMEHIADHATLLSELARVVKPGGALALVVNHPIYTAPGSAPIAEPDGEVLWRPGRYFDTGYSDEPAGKAMVRFHHRPLGALLSVAADSGWDLRRLEEFGVSDAQVTRHPPLALQRHIPRLLGVRWIRR